jgi:hypothetical protein
MRDLKETTISAGSGLRLGRAEEEEIYSLYGLHLAIGGDHRGEQPGGCGTDKCIRKGHAVGCFKTACFPEKGKGHISGDMYGSGIHHIKDILGSLRPLLPPYTSL